MRSLAAFRRTSAVRPAAAASWTWDTAPFSVSNTSGTHDYYNLNIDYTGTSTTAGCVTNTGSGTAIHRFYNCRFRSKSHIVYSSGAAGFEFYNCVGAGLDPVVDGQAWGNVLTARCNWLVMENCTWYTLGGIRLNTTNLTYARVLNNKAINFNGYKSNGTGLPGLAGTRVPSAYDDTANFVRTQFFQLNGITAGAGGSGAGTGGTSRSEIGWNYIVTTPGEGLVEDSLSFISGGGVSGNHLWVHHNLIYGGSHYDPPNLKHSGRGIQHEDVGTDPGYIDIEDNIIAGYNGAIQIYSPANNINIRRNRAFFSGYANGERKVYLDAPTYYRAAPYIASSASGTDQVWEDNEYHWDTLSYTAPGDFLSNIGNTGNSNSGWVETTPACTESNETASISTWESEASSAGETIGSSLTL